MPEINVPVSGNVVDPVNGLFLYVDCEKPTEALILAQAFLCNDTYLTFVVTGRVRILNDITFIVYYDINKHIFR